MRKKNTISFFLPDLGIGGAQKGFILIANELIQLGYSVDLLIFSSSKEMAIYLDNKVNIINFHKKNAYLSLIPLTRYLIKSKPTSLIISLDLTNLIAIIAKIISRQSTKISIYIVNSTSLQRRTKFKKFLEKLFLRLLYPLADHIIANSYGAREDLANYLSIPLNSIIMQYLPTVGPNLDLLSSEEIVHPWFVKGSPPVIIGVGRLVEQKNFGLLIDSFAIVSKQVEANLMIIGDGEQFEMLQRKIIDYGLEEKVELAGYLINPYPYVKKAALVAVPSNWDGLSMILIEAMYLGTSVICTDCMSGPREALDNGKYGIIVPIGDGNALAEGLIKLLREGFPKVDPTWMEQFSVEYGTQKLLAKIGITQTPDNN